MRNLEGLVAVVTGGGAGIGHAIALKLARAGASISIADVSTQAAEASAAAITDATGARTLPVECDVTREDSVADAVDQVLSTLGKVDILINNAGIMVPRLEHSYTVPVDEFDRMLAVHLRGTFLMCRAVVPNMVARRFGRVVNLSSVLGIVGSPYRIAYGIAKSGIISHTRTLAIETARNGITVNAIAPGYILTETLKRRVEEGVTDYEKIAERTPAGHWGRPEDVAEVAAFLASPSSSYITGTVIPVDGGYSIRGDAGDDLGPLPGSSR